MVGFINDDQIWREISLSSAFLLVSAPRQLALADLRDQSLQR